MANSAGGLRRWTKLVVAVGRLSLTIQLVDLVGGLSWWTLIVDSACGLSLKTQLVDSVGGLSNGFKLVTILTDFVLDSVVGLGL